MTTPPSFLDPNSRWSRIYPTLAPDLAPPLAARLGIRTAAVVDGNGRVLQLYLWTCLERTWWRKKEE